MATLETSAGSVSAVAPTDHPVLQLIRERVRTGSRPSERVDGAKLALVIEGGGMRGVVSAGMDAALEDLGELNAFDEIYGASAGSFNAAYLLSHRARVGATIYYEDVNNRHFVDRRRAFREPILDLDFMVDNVAEYVKPIDWQRVVDSEIPLHVVAFSLEERSSTVVPFSNKTGLKLALKASSCIPWVAGNPIEIDGRLYWDASFSDASIPVAMAHSRGATHVLAFLTRPRGVLRGRPNFLEKHVVAPHVRKFGRELADIYLSRAEHYKDSIASITEASQNPSCAPFTMGVVLGPDAAGVSQLESDHTRLFAGAVAGYRAMRMLFDATDFAVVHELRGFHF